MTHTKAKRCWICGRKLYQWKNFPMVIDGYERALHKSCRDQHKEESGRDGNAFGMEY